MTRGGWDAGRDRGAVLIEFALVALLLFTLVFGIIDFGGAYNDQISVRQGARDGVRQSVTGRIGTDTSCAPVGGTPANASVHKVVCLTKSRVGLDEDDTRVKIDVNDPAGSDRGSVAVCVMYPLGSVTGFFPMLDGRVVRTEVQMRTEQTVSEALGTGNPDLVDYTEPALSGQNWSFCAAENT